ncbi:hypothetical protein STIAU_2111 [Stigmatella aurantiaca DW4/3-1]|uniref:Uncharacterized protein n=1 Tax=Stigmatella aurantiaca (strain DW4/3-1) TaxID=378806 RepID=Q09CL6_STIAD|nr:hypothetical protein STIAU_2111 [Stigmatella aurantiaca DW4/3-1]
MNAVFCTGPLGSAGAEGPSGSRGETFAKGESSAAGRLAPGAPLVPVADRTAETSRAGRLDVPPFDGMGARVERSEGAAAFSSGGGTAALGTTVRTVAVSGGRAGTGFLDAVRSRGAVLSSSGGSAFRDWVPFFSALGAAGGRGFRQDQAVREVLVLGEESPSSSSSMLSAFKGVASSGADSDLAGTGSAGTGSAGGTKPSGASVAVGSSSENGIFAPGGATAAISMVGEWESSSGTGAGA